MTWSSPSRRRSAALTPGPEAANVDPGAAPPPLGIENGPAELVADLIEATRLVPLDRLALVRGLTRQGSSFADALVAEGLASSEGVARMLAARHRLPLVDLQPDRRSAEASVLVPLHVLRRAVALPYRLDGETLHVALADPQNVHAIDELRLATRYQLSIGVAARDDILVELDRMDRVSDAVRRDVRRVGGRRRGESPTSRRTTASRTGRSSGWSTRSSSRRPRTAPATSTSRRRRTACSSGSGSTASCTRCSGSRGGCASG